MIRRSASLCRPAALLLTLIYTPALGAQEGVTLTSDAVEVDLGGRLQTQLNTTTVDTEPDAQIFLRRARLELGVVASELILGRFQVDFAGNRASVKDAYVQLNISPALQLLAGNAYRPFSLLQNTSSVRTLPIERGVTIRGVGDYDQFELVSDLGYADRDIGLQAFGSPEGAPLGFSYQAGVFAGPQLPGRPANTSPFQLVARAGIAPLTDVRFGAAWSNRAFSPPAGTQTERGNAFEVDVELGGFDPGFHLLGELSTGDFDPFVDADFFGAQAWLGYRTRPLAGLSTIEPIFRISDADIDELSGVSGGTLLTPGVNFYFDSRNRLMLNYDIWSGSGEGPDAGSFKSQVQLVF